MCHRRPSHSRRAEKEMPMSKPRILAGLAGTLLALTAPAQTPEGTAFTYQGLIKLNGQALSQTADFQFRLYDAAAGGTQKGPQVALPGVSVAGGLLTAPLD